MNFNAVLNDDVPDVNPVEVLPVSRRPLTLDAVKPDFAPYLKRIEEMTADAKALDVSDEQSLKFAVSLGGESQKIVKAIEAQRKKVIQEPSEYIKAVNNFCKIFTEQLAQAGAVLKKKVSDFEYKRELDRRKQEEAARKAAKELQERLDKEAAEATQKAKKENPEAKEIQAPVVQEPVIPKESGVTRTETGTSAHQRKVWKAEVTDANQVPREFCMPDIKKINEAVRMGVREIPGVRIWEDSQTVFRS